MLIKRERIDRVSFGWTLPRYWSHQVGLHGDDETVGMLHSTRKSVSLPAITASACLHFSPGYTEGKYRSREESAHSRGDIKNAGPAKLAVPLKVRKLAESLGAAARQRQDTSIELGPIISNQTTLFPVEPT